MQQAKSRTLSQPVKVTRSVGLQINLSNPIVAAAATATQVNNINYGKENVVLTVLLKVSVIKKPTVSVSTEPQKSSSPPVATITIKPTTPAQSTPQVTVSPTPQSPSGNSGNNNQCGVLARVPIPPSFTMQEPGIASYVPSQAMPRYRNLLPKKAEEQTPSPKLATYVNINGVVNKPTSVSNAVSSAANLLKNSNVNITPVQSSQKSRSATAPATHTADSLAKSRPGLTVTNANSEKISTVAAGPISPPPVQPTVPMPRWSRGPGVGPVTRATTVHKVTLPGRLPNVIDLTSEDLEREKEKTTLVHLQSPAVPTKPSPVKTA